MPRFSRLVVSAAVTALAITALGAPAAAADFTLDPKITVVQGNPGRVDICIDGKKVLSNAKFRKWKTTTVEPGQHRIKARRASTATCKGALIVAKTVTMGPGETLTAVVKPRRPRMIIFRNEWSGIGLVSVADEPGDPVEVPVALRHAAAARDVEMTMGVGVDIPPFLPTNVFDEPWNQGDRIAVPFPDLADAFVSAHKYATGKRLAKSRMVDLKPGKAYEIYFVGWNSATYRWVVVKTPFPIIPWELLPIPVS